MKKYIAIVLLVFITISLIVGLATVNSEVAADTGYPQLPDDLSPPIPAPWPEEPGKMPELVGGRKADRPIVFSYPQLAPGNKPAAPTEPEINVWYDTSQKFGIMGNPQQWVNILGNMPDPTNNSTLAYSLNSGTDQNLSIGPNNDRLDAKGDFNIEIDYSSLQPGSNSVVIKASDGVTPTQKTVIVNYSAGQTWPDNYDAVWSSSSNIQDIAQVVDGNWKLDGNSTYIDADSYGYDRLLAIGDETWTDYEVTVPITVFGIDPEGMKPNGNGAGVGFIMRWLGHTNKAGEQPNADWNRTGAIGWYRWNSDLTEGLELRGYDWKRPLSFDHVLEFGKTYMLKLSVQSVPDQPAYYRLKLWKASETEPLAWDIQGFSSNLASPAGSLLLLAHHADAKFGEVKVRALEDMQLTVDVTVEGEGNIVLDPDQEFFAYSDRVFVYALPEFGYDFSGWSGDYKGTDNPADFRIYRDMELTATFAPKPPTSLDITIEGEGNVLRNPNKSEYLWGEQVELTAQPGDDYIFSHWTGDVTGFENPTTLVMDADKNVTAVFSPASEATPMSDDFSQCRLNTNLWSVVNPAGDAKIVVTGTVAKISIPAGSPHNMWQSNSDALRIMQPTDDRNFEIEVKFNTLPTKRFQMQGILVQQNNNNWLRFDYYHDGANLIANAARTINGNSSNVKFAAVDPGSSTNAYIKVERNGDKWTQSYSFNGNDWTTFAVFIQALEVNSSGLFAGNAAQTPGAEPAFVARADYFFNTALPIVPEDQGNTIDVKVEGQGQVQVDPLKDIYNCDEKVTLTATAANDWIFAGWSGDLQGSTNPKILTVSGDHKITARFSQGVELYLPLILAE